MRICWAAKKPGTIPHALEPGAPGADEIVVSLYDTIDDQKLHLHRSEVNTLFSRNACLRNRAARYIASAGSLLLDNRRSAACCMDIAKVNAYAKRLVMRLLPRTNGKGSQQLRFLSALTPEGPLFFDQTVAALAPHKIVFQDEQGAASRLILEALRTEALARGYTVIACPCALHPEDKLDHLLIPSLGLAFLTSNSWHTCSFPGQQNVRCLRFLDAKRFATYRARLRFNRRAAADLIEESVSLMAQAKRCHDKLETYYREAVDFAAVEAAGAACAESLGLK